MPKSLFLSLLEELRVYILGCLSCRDILCCASVCKALRQTYMSSSELQYIVELSGQCLLFVSNTGDHTPISERLQRLRDKAHAWLKLNAFAFQTGTLPIPFPTPRYFTGEHLYSWIHHSDLVIISPIPSKHPQQTIEHEWSPKTLCPLIFPRRVKYILMDPAQNLFGIMYIVDNMAYRIYLATLDDGHVHPHAAGPALDLELSVYAFDVKLECYGRHIALWRCETSRFSQTWHLQIWDWQHSTTSSSALSGSTYTSASFCFLGNDRLIVFARDLELYSIEDTSGTPQLLACFRLPFPLVNLESDHSSQPGMQTQAQSVYTSDPKHRLLCVYSLTDDVRKIFVISTKIFFDIDQAAVKPWVYKPWRYGIPWQHWGPGHVRVLKYKARNKTKIHLCGNRVLLVDKITSKTHAYKLRMMDFSPLAVANRRGLGRVVKERLTTTSGSISKWPDKSWNNITHWHSTIETSMPYVEVVSSRKIAGGGLLQDAWMDDDRIYLVFVTSCSRDRKLQVIDIY